MRVSIEEVEILCRIIEYDLVVSFIPSAKIKANARCISLQVKEIPLEVKAYVDQIERRGGPAEA